MTHTAATEPPLVTGDAYPNGGRPCCALGPEHAVGGPVMCTRFAGHVGMHEGYGFAMRTIEWGR
jgi:hypothetical protein